jgi:hypothetical protein
MTFYFINSKSQIQIKEANSYHYKSIDYITNNNILNRLVEYFIDNNEEYFNIDVITYKKFRNNLHGLITENSDIKIKFRCINGNNISPYKTTTLKYNNSYLVSCHFNIPEVLLTKIKLINFHEDHTGARLIIWGAIMAGVIYFCPSIAYSLT